MGAHREDVDSGRAQLNQLDSLEELSGWAGTFRERLRIARSDRQAALQNAVDELEAPFQARRAELA